MPLRLVSGLGSQDEADAFAWAADRGGDVISCSWGGPEGLWWILGDPLHDQVLPLPDSTRLAIENAVATGRGGKGCVITWAAGNGAESVDNDGYASYQRAIAVAACNDSGTQSAYSDFGDAIWCCFPNVPGPAGLRGQRARLGQSHRPQPAVDPGAFHA